MGAECAGGYRGHMMNPLAQGERSGYCRQHIIQRCRRDVENDTVNSTGMEQRGVVAVGQALRMYVEQSMYIYRVCKYFLERRPSLPHLSIFTFTRVPYCSASGPCLAETGETGSSIVKYST